MQIPSEILRGLKTFGRLTLRAAENSAHRLAVLAALGTFAALLLLADGHSERIAIIAGFAAGTLSLAFGLVQWIMTRRAVLRREGRGLFIFNLCLLIILGILMADRGLRIQIARMGNAVGSMAAGAGIANE